MSEITQDVTAALPILVAAPDEWRETICIYLRQHGLTIREADTYDSALALLRLESVRGLIMTSEWAVPDAAKSIRGLFQETGKKIPAVILVRRDESFDHYFDQYYALYLPYDPMLAGDDYIRIPFSLESLLHSMRTLDMIE